VLNYGRTPPLGWRRVAKWVVRLILIAGLVAGMGWGAKTVWQSWGRYRYQQNWIAATAALTKTPLPPDTVIIDPASGPVTYMKTFTYANGYSRWRTLAIPTDPARETQLRLMRRFDSFSAFALTSELQTGRGKAFVKARIDTSDMENASPTMQISVLDETIQPGQFPFYRYALRGFLTNLQIIPSEGRALPTVFIGQIDPGGSSWTLPLRVDGKAEWVRFDHSGPTWPTVTASFGQLTSSGSQWELKY
jgi:hypothetical protein